MYIGFNRVEVTRTHKARLLIRTAGRKDTLRQYYLAEHGLRLSIEQELQNLTSFRYFPCSRSSAIFYLLMWRDRCSPGASQNKPGRNCLQNLSAILSSKPEGKVDIWNMPTFEYFAGSSALKRHGLHLDTTAPISLPPSLHSISIINCRYAKQDPIMLRRVIEECSVKSIQSIVHGPHRWSAHDGALSSISCYPMNLSIRVTACPGLNHDDRNTLPQVSSQLP